ncbi:hypothetical protein [Fructilactobacillus lindneri]|uniref:Uncharacterized protein n=2 Tax=Fructilactobacillus lindneri TaxID=53444 RepID=A0A0R2JME4_9LACO|nr:hypothetical protein [Fructilactobacillus lindneri]ANZ59316.1 hypothetical protein AYR59_04515 [Fructilactobacillus lindneri]KRN78322.1 hypothetical protein IV52_GL001259 [Fructilactobacillus lindneri DSM 20690 = JCM 11027]POH04358.1 hypothetical protein BGL33_07010 [Fructilactobacillus lindneri]POH05349.1 hypothetical protein BGL35_06180 [Fructilactobacillus lindneri]POH05931.1 hypothetical protein BGL36_05810 [Fructilactobacillus lindneri]
MNDVSLVEIHKQAAEKVAYEMIAPIAENIKLDYVTIDTKLARVLTRQSANEWQDIAKTPAMRAIEHHKKTSTGAQGRSIYYWPEEFYPTVKKVLRERMD